MKYKTFEAIIRKRMDMNTSFEKQIIEKMIKQPKRFLGEWKFEGDASSIIQTFTQSKRIKFGYALEELCEAYFKEASWKVLEKNFYHKETKYSCDLLLKKGRKILFVEQKIRDDHDSTKKKGQIQNFFIKLEYLTAKYESYNVIARFHFIDKLWDKNKVYYTNEIEKKSKKYKNIKLVYDKDLFVEFGMKKEWNQLKKYINKFKNDYDDELMSSKLVSTLEFSKKSKEELQRRIHNKEIKGDALKVISRYLTKRK